MISCYEKSQHLTLLTTGYENYLLILYRITVSLDICDMYELEYCCKFHIYVFLLPGNCVPSIHPKTLGN